MWFSNDAKVPCYLEGLVLLLWGLCLHPYMCTKQFFCGSQPCGRDQACTFVRVHRVCGSYDVVGEYIVSGRDLISLSQSSVDSHEIEIPEGTHWVVDFPAGFLWESKYVFSTSYSYSLLHLNSSANRNQYCSIKVGYRCAILSSFYHDLTHFTTLFN